MGAYVSSLPYQPPMLPTLFGFEYSPMEDSHHIQLEACIVADGATCQRIAPNTSIPWEPPTGSMSYLRSPPGPVRRGFPFIQN
jgi:hypothetical protein